MKNTRNLNYERAAMVLCDAVIMGDRGAAKKWGMSLRTVQRYRKLLDNDDKLRQLVKELRERQVDKWLENLPEAIDSVVVFMKKSTDSMEAGDPDNLLAAAKALEVLFDMKVTSRVIDARLGGG